MKKGLLVLWLWSANCWADLPILPLSQGLTLAEVERDGQVHTLAVIRDENRTITALDLSVLLDDYREPIQVYQRFGYHHLRDLIQLAPKGVHQQIDYAQLKSPAGSGEHHLALGLNYADHAEEVDGQALPFVFPKLTQATREEDIPYQHDRLLDYEVELCARPLKNHQAAISESTLFAYFLCGDFTDRATLLQLIDTDNMQSGKGFSEAKSAAGYFPTGPYLIIPNQPDLVDPIQLTLFHNDILKQQSQYAASIWSVAYAVNKVLSYQQANRSLPNQMVQSWLPSSQFSTDICLLTGTPDGVLMQPPGLGYRLLGGIKYVFGGAIFSDRFPSVKDYVIDQFIQDSFVQKRFLQPRDEIRMQATYLGHISLRVGE